MFDLTAPVAGHSPWCESEYTESLARNGRPHQCYDPILCLSLLVCFVTNMADIDRVFCLTDV